MMHKKEINKVYQHFNEKKINKIKKEYLKLKKRISKI